MADLSVRRYQISTEDTLARAALLVTTMNCLLRRCMAERLRDTDIDPILELAEQVRADIRNLHRQVLAADQGQDGPRGHRSILRSKGDH